MNVGSPTPAHLQYQSLMLRIRARFEIIDLLDPNEVSDLSTLETVAFRLRKIVEGVAFGCLVAVENGLKKIPRGAVGQWNADIIFSKLKKLPQLAFPEPFERRDPTDECTPEVSHHIVARHDLAITIDDLRAVYKRTHAWLHEWNPYVTSHNRDFEKRRKQLLEDEIAVRNLMWQHLIGIGGEIFLGMLKDPSDGQVRVVAATSRVA